MYTFSQRDATIAFIRSTLFELGPIGSRDLHTYSLQSAKTKHPPPLWLYIFFDPTTNRPTAGCSITQDVDAAMLHFTYIYIIYIYICFIINTVIKSIMAFLHARGFLDAGVYSMRIPGARIVTDVQRLGGIPCITIYISLVPSFSFS